jgi:hypothetical protein
MVCISFTICELLTNVINGCSFLPILLCYPSTPPMAISLIVKYSISDGTAGKETLKRERESLERDALFYYPMAKSKKKTSLLQFAQQDCPCQLPSSPPPSSRRTRAQTRRSSLGLHDCQTPCKHKKRSKAEMTPSSLLISEIDNGIVGCQFLN